MTSLRALASMASHLCWYWALMSGSLEVSEFLICSPAATRATWLFPGFASTLDSSTRKVGWRDSGVSPQPRRGAPQTSQNPLKPPPARLYPEITGVKLLTRSAGKRRKLRWFCRAGIFLELTAEPGYPSPLLPALKFLSINGSMGQTRDFLDGNSAWKGGIPCSLFC